MHDKFIVAVAETGDTPHPTPDFRSVRSAIIHADAGCPPLLWNWYKRYRPLFEKVGSTSMPISICSCAVSTTTVFFRLCWGLKYNKQHRTTPRQGQENSLGPLRNQPSLSGEIFPSIERLSAPSVRVISES